MVIDSDGVILYASDNIKSFVALDARDVIGFSLHNFVLSQQDSYTLTKNLEPDGKTEPFVSFLPLNINPRHA